MYIGQRLAIDIGSSSIKILFGNSKKIFHATVIETPKNSFEDNMVVDIEKIYCVIKDHIIENKLKARCISFSIHGQDAVIRHIEIPIMDKRKLGEAIEWEISQYLPEGGANYCIDYEIIDRVITNEKKVYKLLVVAVLKEKVERYAELSNKLGFKLKAIDIAANCTARIFTYRGAFKKSINSIGVIDLGNKSSSIVIIENGKLFMEREISFGIENIIKEISKEQQISIEESTDYLIKKFDFCNKNMEFDLDRKIMDLFKNGILNFQRAIEFYTAGKVKKNLDEVFVIGGGSGLRGIKNFLDSYLSSPVYLAYSLEDLGRRMYCPGNIKLSLYINAMGLMLRKE